ncbi:MAG: DNA-binding response regulator [Chitinophaga sp.]|jgi:two-component system, LytTR family, response regulator|nr:DNA-binding response regulator [Chitinophaga sp.]
MLNCVAIDDEPLALELIKNHIKQMRELQLLQAFDDAVAGASFLRLNKVDLLFVDINMPDITGIDLVKNLQHKPLIIFTTAYRKFAVEGFELDAIDYLMKPITFDRFRKAALKAVDFHEYKNNMKDESNESIFVRSEYKLVRIPLNDIEYIEGLEDYIKIHFTNAKPLLTLMTMKGILEKLPPEKFTRIHRSYIIPLNRIQSFVNKKILLNTGKELPVSNSYIEFINNMMKK